MIPSMEVRAGIFDEMSTAISVDYGVNVSQTIESKDDVDWFCFKTNDYAAYYSIHVSNLSEDSGGNGLNNELGYRIYDDENTCLYDVHSYGRLGNGTKDISLSAGKTYYL